MCLGQSASRARSYVLLANNSLQRPGWFLPFSGHLDLTIRIVKCHDQDRERLPATASTSRGAAVALSHLPGVAVQDVAASLYIHPFMLSRWRKQAREGRIVTKGVKLDADVAAELKAFAKLKK